MCLSLLAADASRVIVSRICTASEAFRAASAGTRSELECVASTAVANAASMHAVQRSSTVDRPGRTKAQISTRGAPLAIALRHLRQRPRPVGARLRRYVLLRCLKVKLRGLTHFLLVLIQQFYQISSNLDTLKLCRPGFVWVVLDAKRLDPHPQLSVGPRPQLRLQHLNSAL